MPSASASPTPTTPANGQVLIVTAVLDGSRLDVTAMIPGVSEDGGVCTLSLAGSAEKSTVTAAAGNGVTYCGVMSVTVPQARESDGSFVVGYVSGTVRAESAPTTLASLR